MDDWDDPNDTARPRPRDDGWELEERTPPADDVSAPGSTGAGDDGAEDDGAEIEGGRADHRADGGGEAGKSAATRNDAPNTDEDVVRRYLTWIDDPASLRDDERIAELQSRIDAARDPIEKIHLASELHFAQKVDGTDLRRDFLAVARRWAEANRIAPEAFLQVGVPPEDLRQAGFDVEGRPARRAETGTVPPSTRRAERVGADRIREGAMSFDAPFTIADLRDRVGGSPATVRKALEALVAEGRVENLGPDASWPGPGRPPNRYVSRRS